MQIFSLVIAFSLVGLTVWFGVDIYRGYAKGTGTTWERLLNAGKDSATMLWGKFTIVLAGIVGNLDKVADFLGQPEVKTYIETALGNPKAVALAMVGIAAVTMWARLRTL